MVIPFEGDPRESVHGLDDSLRRELMEKAREAGLLAPQAGEEWGGLGLDMRSMAVVFEAAGYSLLGPHALNCAAPDEGNMHRLEVVASDAQKVEWLRPLAAGDIRSCFSMTELAFSCKRRGLKPELWRATHGRDRRPPRRTWSTRATDSAVGAVLPLPATVPVRDTPRGRVGAGAVTLIQRFGSALNLNPHLHMPFLDGAYPFDDEAPRCRSCIDSSTLSVTGRLNVVLDPIDFMRHIRVPHPFGAASGCANRQSCRFGIARLAAP